jgi:hypothetical protein
LSRRKKSSINGVASSHVVTYGSWALDEFMSTTATSIATGRRTAATLGATVDWSRLNGNGMGFTSYQLLNEGASISASADRLLGRRWNPQRLCALGSVIR